MAFSIDPHDWRFSVIYFGWKFHNNLYLLKQTMAYDGIREQNE